MWKMEGNLAEQSNKNADWVLRFVNRTTKWLLKNLPDFVLSTKTSSNTSAGVIWWGPCGTSVVGGPMCRYRIIVGKE